MELNFKRIDRVNTDLEYLLFLKSDQQDIYWSGYTSPPIREYFVSWYETQLERNDREIWLVFSLIEEAVGYLYITLDKKNRIITLSHGVASAYNGQGIGSQIIQFAVKRCSIIYPNYILNAWIAQENIASAKTFLKNQFQKNNLQTKIYYKSFGREVILENYLL
jgi:GNAT superfamily N-acetyltransferase